jgi:hypothetical protein
MQNNPNNMTTSEDFVNWLEGFLDACKNAPTSMQIREVRKKIANIRPVAGVEQYNSLWDSNMPPQPTRSFSTITLVQPPKEEINSKNEPVNEDFIRAIEENKKAATMEELNS